MVGAPIVSTSVTDAGGRRVILQFRDAELKARGPEVDVELATDVGGLAQLLNKILENEEAEQYTFEVAGNRDPSGRIPRSSAATSTASSSQLTTASSPSSSSESPSAAKSADCPNSAAASEGKGDHERDASAATEAASPVSTTSDESSKKAQPRSVGETNDAPTPAPFSTTCLALGPEEKLVELAQNSTLADAVAGLTSAYFTQERVLQVTFYPLAIFRVRPVTRCSSSMEGHAEAVLCSRFSPDCSMLATGSGDATLRLWDMNTEACVATLRGHSHHVLTCEWSPCGALLASAGMDKKVMVWCPHDGARKFALTGHREPVTSLAWQPLHCVPANNVSKQRPLLASTSKDGDARVWDTVAGNCVYTLGGHTAAVMQIRWSGERHALGGVLYTAGRDRVIKCWNASNGQCVKTLKGHAHWINSLALNVDYVLRTGHFEPKKIAEIKVKHGVVALKEKASALELGAGSEEMAEEDVEMAEAGDNAAVNNEASMAKTTGQTKKDEVSTMTVAGSSASSAVSKLNIATMKNANLRTSVKKNVAAVKSKAQEQSRKQKLAAKNASAKAQQEVKKAKAVDRSTCEENNPERFKLALARYQEAIETAGGERLLSASDDFTMFLWRPLEAQTSSSSSSSEDGSKKRLTGHQQVVSQAIFSPDGRWIASGSFDRSIRLWDGRTGRFVARLLGHVGKVFQMAWSADSRLLLSGSADSTMKVWEVAKKKLLKDLPGHADEVYAVDWAQDGCKACSGSKDRLVKIWRF
ncbi:unnamed protein product [Amoebophrya sp. A25]|nr:unnamed protein product [Amoebophrya sp. A25]|eukprot:GSA25T00005888001.1